MGFAFLVQQLLGALASLFLIAPLTSGGAIEPINATWGTSQLNAFDLEDIDCDGLKSAVVDWARLRLDVNEFDSSWSILAPPPPELCFGNRARQGILHGEVNVVLKLHRQASDECHYGALAAAVIALACHSDCGRGTHAFVASELWRSALMAGEHGNETVDGAKHSTIRWPFILGTSTWRVGSLLTKWSYNCSSRSSLQPRVFPKPCGTQTSQDMSAFYEGLHDHARRCLTPLFLGPSAPAPSIIFDAKIDLFAKMLVPSLRVLSSQIQNNREHDRLASLCPLEMIARSSSQILMRLLGPPVQPNTDPHSDGGYHQLSSMLHSIPLSTMLMKGWSTLAMLAVLRYVSWRSHRLFSATSQVSIVDVRRIHAMAQDSLREREVDAHFSDQLDTLRELRTSELVRRTIWESVGAEAFEASRLDRLWPLIARWLLQAPKSVPNAVYLTMAWGGVMYVPEFLKRAIRVGIPRLIFLTPSPHLVSICNDLIASEPGMDLSSRILCVRTIVDFERPYDYNNYSKFVLIPLLLALGLDVAWLDIDVFVIRDPTAAYLEKAAAYDGDVFTTDHWSLTCLNHGVFYIRASDRTLVWILYYIKWLHQNPFSHDQDGWDSFLGHSILRDRFVSPIVDACKIRSYVLETAYTFLTLNGFAGESQDVHRAMLLHMTPSRDMDDKHARLAALYNASAPMRLAGHELVHRERAAVRRTLLKLRAPVPKTKGWCYMGAHWIAIFADIKDNDNWATPYYRMFTYTFWPENTLLP
eukprot:TRINITY_DN28897_c0_g1_i1.p1 TRINITY_DN28897_c0_g1~~TRINITY_DN28897_c0_g1_i1.p1  ORF type:complete len:756 (+),score=61.85 TRINITY_DN28897_c0_g1_i1:85-2352(+)